MAKSTARGRRRNSSSKARRGSGGVLSWAVVGIVAIGAISAYDNWKSLRPLISQTPDASVLTAAIRPDAPKAAAKSTEKPPSRPLRQKDTVRSLPSANISRPSAQPVKAEPAEAGETIKTVQVSFGYCGQGQHVNCVGDGGVFWYKGEKILVADMVTPDVAKARCDSERRIAFAAKARLFGLLNAGPFTMNAAGDAGSNGAPRLILRSGRSFGAQLVSEGLARKPGLTGSWCA
jgi:endonuclease YncB( thermonuclease family)